MSTASPTPSPFRHEPAGGMPLLEVEGLGVALTVPGRDGHVDVVSDVSFGLAAGEIVGLVGESGSGKSITAMSLLGLLPRNARTRGSARFRGRELLGLSARELREVRGNEIGVVYQEPMSALDPVVTIGEQIAETVRAHRNLSRQAARQRAVELLGRVGIPDPGRRYRYYPHELSGGMRQRVVIAIALSCDPAILIADEPTTALDVTIQAQILDLLQSMSAENAMAVVLISHNLGVVAQICKRVMVMYAGQLIEAGPIDEVLSRPAHPYTSGLLAAMPLAHATGTLPRPIAGRLPAPGSIEQGCRFAPRCGFVRPPCREREQVLAARRSGEPPHSVRCGRADELELVGMDTACAAPAATTA